MKEKIDLTIIVPIYNVEQYLEECLESVYPLNIKKEIILVDDGTKDSSLDIAKKFADIHSEETVLISKENGGLSSARNVGLREARGEYVYFLDSDDYIITEEFENFFLEIQESDLDILHGLGEFFGKIKIGPIQKIPESVLGAVMTGKEYIYRMFELDCYVDYVWLNIYRKDYLLENQFFFVEGITFEDVIFSPPVYRKTLKIKQSGVNFYRYRIRENSISQQGKKSLDHLYVYNFLLDYVLEEKISHPGLTRLITSRIRKLAKEEKVFNEEIYKKLWKLPKKKWISLRNLLDLFWRKYTTEKISYEEIQQQRRKRK